MALMTTSAKRIRNSSHLVALALPAHASRHRVAQVTWRPLGQEINSLVFHERPELEVALAFQIASRRTHVVPVATNRLAEFLGLVGNPLSLLLEQLLDPAGDPLGSRCPPAKRRFGLERQVRVRDQEGLRMLGRRLRGTGPERGTDRPTDAMQLADPAEPKGRGTKSFTDLIVSPSPKVLVHDAPEATVVECHQ